MSNMLSWVRCRWRKSLECVSSRGHMLPFRTSCHGWLNNWDRGLYPFAAAFLEKSVQPHLDKANVACGHLCLFVVLSLPASVPQHTGPARQRLC